jgi:hypothetical protein
MRTNGFIGDEFRAKGWILPHASIAARSFPS